MKSIILNQSARIINGYDFGKTGLIVKLIENNKNTLVAIRFNIKEYGIYNLSDVEILICC